jgi:glycosyltransferase involved in cell wall biosynthesis
MPYQSPIRVGSHHYAEHFSRHYDVLWISLPWHVFQILKGADNDRYTHYNGGRPVEINDHLKALVPFTFVPYRRGFPFGLGFNVDHYYAFMLPRIRPLLREHGFEDVELVWISDPRHISILKRLHYRKLAYRCVDNLEHFADVPRGLLEREIALIRRCDAVFCTSKELLRKFDGLNPRCRYLPNGVDYEFFASPPASAVLSEELTRALDPAPERNVVYMGAVAEWFDFQALGQLTSRYSRHRFAIVGPQRVQPPEALRRAANVTFTGPMPYDCLPALLARCRIGLIPFAVNEITDFVNPIKLFEYFAGGLEVVCSAMKTVRELDSPAWLYEAGGIVAAFESAAKASDDSSRPARLREYARRNSWSSRFSQIIDELGMNPQTSEPG